MKKQIVLKKLNEQLIIGYLFIYFAFFYLLTAIFNFTLFHKFHDSINLVISHKKTAHYINLRSDVVEILYWLTLKNAIIFTFIAIISYLVFYFKYRPYLKELTLILITLVLIATIKSQVPRLYHFYISN
jgi:hypothetical protein